MPVQEEDGEEGDEIIEEEFEEAIEEVVEKKMEKKVKKSPDFQCRKYFVGDYLYCNGKFVGKIIKVTPQYYGVHQENITGVVYILRTIIEDDSSYFAITEADAGPLHRKTWD